jgi:hypothetical protein
MRSFFLKKKEVYSILSPKNVSLYNDFIESEASALVEHLVDETQREGSVDPRKNIVLNTMNVICHVSVGKKFESTEDPIYKQIMFMVEQGLYFTGFAFDLPNFFPFLSIFYKNFGIEKQMSDFIDNVRDPLMTKLIREAKINKDAPNIIRSIEEEFGLDDEEQNMILLSKC